jgi:acyl-CoA reductase-like NAD-dependent aldehyde dehydrogenase
MMEKYLMLIDGEWVESKSGTWEQVINPANEEPFAQVPSATKEDVDRAVQAAHRAFKEWSETSLDERPLMSGMRKRKAWERRLPKKIVDILAF